jgi:exosortase D (VPLPA-CTERM-specific)
MTLGVIVGYLFRSRMWMRWCVFLSTVPITILMNSFRIGVIGILVDRFGIAQAEGFLHLFEGWVVFMACFLLLFAECKLLLLLSGDRRHLRELLAIELPRIRAAGGVATPRVLGAPALVALALLLAAVYPARALPQRVELRPAREDFSGFPLRLADWQGRRQTLEQIYLDTLQLDDYLLANYFEASAQGGAGAAPSMVNVYVAYYASQRTGQSAHSPRSCLPGGGWGISDFGQRDVPGVTEHGVPLRVNRAVIQHGANRQLVYYWFQERGRDITNEYLVKWHLVTDAILRNRTDGALVRLVTPLPPDEDIAAADARLAQFSAALRPVLGRYLPD